MLVSSHRHTREDLTYWHEYESADFIPQLRHDKQVDAAKREIAQFLTSRWPCYAGVSWGKDSVVVAHLLWRFARHVPLMHLRPSNHNPDCDVVRDIYFATYPGQEYREVSVDYSGIDRTRLARGELDRSTDKRWYAAIDGFSVGYVGKILGIRGEESTPRRMRMLRWGCASPNSLAPIGYWKTADVFSYLARNLLPVHPAYACLGGGRWPRELIRVAEIGDTNGTSIGRREWELEYYGDELRRMERDSRLETLRNHQKKVD